MERDSLKFRNAQTRFSAVQGLLFGSSSSVMLRLVGHGIVSETNSAARGSRRRRLLSSAKGGVRGGDATSLFQAQFATFPSGQSNSNFQSAGFRAGAHHIEPRLSSSFRIMVSAISFMDLRLCWLRRWIVR